ncbi:MAG: TonB-dependent receptor domain-containing protein, partial [Actinomycetota bacterium]
SQVSPRLSVVRGLGPSSRIRASWGRYYQSQGIHELQVEDGVADFLPTQLAQQWSIGYERDLGNGLTLRADAYRKEMSSLRPRFENLFDPFELLPEFAADRVRIAPDRAEARGLDLSLSMDRDGTIAWWAAYSRSSAEDEIDGRTVPRSRDQPHAFQFGLNIRRGDAWSLGSPASITPAGPRRPWAR